jgi:hypothetical protein
MSLLERHIASLENRLVLLAPPNASIPDFFRNVRRDVASHTRLVRNMQKLRGQVYLEDGAICELDLSDDGLHQTPEDNRSWHLLMRGHGDDINACIWYMEYNTLPSFQQLRAQHCPLAQDYGWRDQIRRAVAAEVAQARMERVRYSEVGGWAVTEAARSTVEGIMMILGTFGLSRALGGALGLATATVRHSSASMLQRLGLTRLADVPSYFDPDYSCEMELLRYDTRRSSPKYHQAIEMLKTKLASVPVLMAESLPSMASEAALAGLVRMSRERLVAHPTTATVAA